MPRIRYGQFIHQVYIADGFADDCDELVHRCLQAENLDYHTFCQIWKDMKIGCVYEGRTLGAEIAELSEELIHIGKHYMLKNTSNFEESAIGVFIVYALLHLQPYQGFASIRIIPEDLPAINRLEHVARRDKRYDVLYALGSILTKGPVQYHAAEREYGMDLPIRKYLEGFTSIDKLGVRPKGVFRRQNEELDILRELNDLTQQYTQAKMKISEKTQFDRDLKYYNPKMPKECEDALMKLISGIQEEQYGANLDKRADDSEKILMSRRAIKDKAMTQDVNPVKHMQSSKNRKNSTVTSESPKKTDPKETSKKKTTKKGKNKQEDTAEEKAERKRKIPISPRALKNSLNKSKLKDLQDEFSSENDDYDVNVNDTSKKNDAECAKITEKLKAINIEMEKKIKELGKLGKAAGNKERKEQELDIEIDTLPVLIRTEEQGKVFEIEIIDQKSPEKIIPKPPVKTYKKKDSILKKINSMPGITIEKIDPPDSSEPRPSTSTAYQPATIIGIYGDKEEEVNIEQDVPGLGIPNSKIEKRDCKRVHLKSKFKRLGMLPIANFKAPENTVTTVESDDIEVIDSDEEPLEIIEIPPIE